MSGLQIVPHQVLPTGPHALQVKVTRVNYNIDGQGKIAFSMGTDPILPAELRPKEDENILINVETVYVGDVFTVSRVNDQIHWNWVSREGPGTQGFLACDTERCPVCYEPVIYKDEGIFCINDRCPARIKTNLIRFLVFNKLTCTAQELIVLDNLIYRNMLRTAADLFRITKEDILSLGSAYTVNFAFTFLQKLHSIRGQMTLSTYLRSLNIAWIDGCQLDDDLIDRTFPDIDCFLRWLTEIDHTPNQGAYPYMAQSTYQLLSNYFALVDNVATAKRLQDLQLFRRLDL